MEYAKIRSSDVMCRPMFTSDHWTADDHYLCGGTMAEQLISMTTFESVDGSALAALWVEADGSVHYRTCHAVGGAHALGAIIAEALSRSEVPPALFALIGNRTVTAAADGASNATHVASVREIDGGMWRPDASVISNIEQAPQRFLIVPVRVDVVGGVVPQSLEDAFSLLKSLWENDLDTLNPENALHVFVRD